MSVMTRWMVMPSLAYQARAFSRKATALAFFLVGHNLCESEAGMIVHADVDVLPADPPMIALASTILGDAMAYLIEPPELFDVDVDHLAGFCAFVALHRLGGLQIAPAVEPMAGQDAPDGSPGNAGLGGDAQKNTAFLAKGDNLGLQVVSCSCGVAVRFG